MVLVNLKPAKLAGVLSEGMLFVQKMQRVIWHCDTGKSNAGRSRDLLED